MNIINDGFPEDNEILLDEISITYVQDNDCTESRDGEPQSITLSTRDGGGGKFLHIKTTGWSVSDSDDLVKLINDFTKRYAEASDKS